MLYRMSKRSGSVRNLYSFNFRLQKMAMLFFIVLRKFNKRAIFRRRKKKLHSLLKLLKRRIRYISSKRKKRKDA
jgi:hypothetical protein